MNAFGIKLLAVVLMVADHVGKLLFPQLLVLQLLGRLSFPLFAWLLGMGERYTKNFNAYIYRLLALAIISQPAYSLAFSSVRLNIFFTLLIGLLTIRYSQHFGAGFRWAIYVCSGLVASVLGFDYGFYGVLTIVLLTRYQVLQVRFWVAWVLLNLLSSLPGSFLYIGSYQFLAVLAPLVVISYKNQQGRKSYLFYAFYPMHLMILYFLAMYV
jgi:hypothetical protein